MVGKERLVRGGGVRRLEASAEPVVRSQSPWRWPIPWGRRSAGLGPTGGWGNNSRTSTGAPWKGHAHPSRPVRLTAFAAFPRCPPDLCSSVLCPHHASRAILCCPFRGTPGYNAVRCGACHPSGGQAPTHGNRDCSSEAYTLLRSCEVKREKFTFVFSPICTGSVLPIPIGTFCSSSRSAIDVNCQQPTRLDWVVMNGRHCIRMSKRIQAGDSEPGAWTC